MNMNRAAPWVVLAAGLLSACGSDVHYGNDNAMLDWGPGSNSLYTPRSDDNGIVGDWFPCADPECKTLSPQGFRFQDDLTVREIRLEQQQGTTLVCLVTGSSVSVTYSWDGKTLTLSDGKVDLTTTFEIQDSGRALWDLPAQVSQPQGNVKGGQTDSLTLVRRDSDPMSPDCTQDILVKSAPAASDAPAPGP
jgi:hypothetical protein